MKIEKKYCLHCHEVKLAIGEPPNHIYWFLFSLATFGIGLAFWIFAYLSGPKTWHCLTCGSEKITPIPSKSR